MTPSDQTQLDAQLQRLHLGYVQSNYQTFASKAGLWRNLTKSNLRLGVRTLDQGMEAALNSAAAMNAYMLADRATWTKFNNRQHLEILSAGDPTLYNAYDSILVNPAKWPRVKFSDARIWHEWLTSESTADAIVMYRINGRQVFFPG